MKARARLGIVSGGILSVVLLAVVPATSKTRLDDATRGARFLAGRQAASGAFISAASADSVAETLAVIAAAPLGDRNVTPALGYIAKHGAARSAERAAYAARITLGLLAAGKDPANFHGDHVEQITRRYDQIKGTYDTGVYSNALAVLGLAAAGKQIPERVFTYFKTNVCRDGGFGHEDGCLSGADVDSTSLVVMALRRARVGASDETASGARAWLLDHQLPGGGFGARPGDPLNANSTGLAISAIVALGEGPTAGAWRQSDGDDPMKALSSLQLSSGGFRLLAGDDKPNDYATVQAVPALARRWYPVRAWGSEATAAVGSSTTPPKGGRDGEAAATPSRSAVKQDAGGRPVGSSENRIVATAGRRTTEPDADPTPLRWIAAVCLLGSAALLAGKNRWFGAR